MLFTRLAARLRHPDHRLELIRASRRARASADANFEPN
jgi:hypothetical protein